MTFNIQGRQINISDDVINNYRKAVGLLPGMKTDDKWFEYTVEIAFKYDIEFILDHYSDSDIKDEVEASLLFEAEQYNALGGGYFQ